MNEKIEALVKRWNNEASNLDGEIVKLVAVRGMIEQGVLESEILWRSIQSDTWKRCAIHLQQEIDQIKHDSLMAEFKTP